MHLPVLKSCLKVGRHLTTSSYVSPDMEKMHEEVKRKGLIFLNEVGLDPGIDIMGTMKVKHDAEA
jgi:saccharopine dehydrogenase-like NADP-dependent oxidoreductase